MCKMCKGTYGAEVEYFVSVENRIARASAIVSRYDSNDSTAEIRTPVCACRDELVEAIQKELAREATHILQFSGPIIAQSAKFIFSPIQVVQLSFGPIEIPLPKTAGIHFHTGYVPQPIGKRVRTTNYFLTSIDNYLGTEAQQRKKTPVIGPLSGNIYSYGGAGDHWREKNKNIEHWEFRPTPTSAIVFDQSALVSMMTLVNTGEINTEDTSRIIEACNESIEVPVKNFLQKQTTTVLMSVWKNGRLESASPETTRYVQSWTGASKRIHVIQIPDYITPEEAGRCFHPNELIVRKSEIELLLNDLYEGNDLTRYVPNKVVPEGITTHRVPPGDSFFKQPILSDPTYDEVRKYIKSTESPRRRRSAPTSLLDIGLGTDQTQFATMTTRNIAASLQQDEPEPEYEEEY